MLKISNELPASAFSSSPHISVRLSQSPTLPLMWKSSSEIRLVVHKPSETPKPRKSESLTVLSIPKGTEIGGWRLKSVMLVQIRRARKQSLATTWLEGVSEYGAAKTDDEAITDLVMSVGEYRESLEKQENELGVSTQKELDYLRRLVERSSANFAGK